MSDFYTNFAVRDGRFYITGYANGHRFVSSEYVDDCVIRTTAGNDTLPVSKYKTLEGNKLYDISFRNQFEMKKFVKENRMHTPFYGVQKTEMELIHKKYPGAFGVSDYDFDMVRTFYFDIEVETEGSYATPENPFQRVNLITVVYNKKVYALGLNPFSAKDRNIKYLHCPTEEDLFHNFFKLVRKIDPDIYSGWNIEGFDIPYMINRCQRVFGTDELASQFSPFGVISQRTIKTKFGDQVVYDFLGATVLDYLPLYKKFQLKKLADYKLDTVAMYELKRGKVDYSEEGSLRNLYLVNWDKFVVYGVEDSIIVSDIDDNRNYISLVFQIAMRSKTNVADVFYQTRLWEQIIYTYLETEQRVLPAYKERSDDPDEEFEGAYVKEPLTGRRDWIVYYDFTSLYPHVMMQFNISPETWIDGKIPLTVQDVIDLNPDKIDTDALQMSQACLAGNGSMFRTDIEGFIPKILKKMFQERKEAKNTMLEYKKGADMIEEELRKRGINE